MNKLILTAMVGGGLFGVMTLRGGEIVSKEYVLKLADKVVWVSDGTESELTEAMDLPFNIKVQTNGTFTVNQGKERALLKDQKLDKTGMLYSPDGTVVPVMDHVVQKSNRPLLFKDGESQSITSALTLEDGTRIMPDGTVMRPNGRTLRLLDGQMLLMTGAVIPTRDTITLKGGKVVLQKDGSRVSLLPTQSIMMNDGTKVFGTGKVLLPDGKSVQLVEDQVLVVEGAVTSGLK